MKPKLTLIGIVVTCAVLLLGLGCNWIHLPPVPTPTPPPSACPPGECERSGHCVPCPEDCRGTGCPEGQQCKISKAGAFECLNPDGTCPECEREGHCVPCPEDCRTTGCPEGETCKAQHGSYEFQCVPDPPPLQCDEASIPVSSVIVNAKVYSKRTKKTGEVIYTFDSTLKVKSAAWCAAHGMAEYGNECPMAPEGDACRNVRERYVLAPHVCPRYVFLTCTASCPGTFDALVGDVLHPINANAGCPMPTNIEQVEAFWTQPEGKGTFAACLWTNGPDGKPLGCGRQFSVDQ